MNRLVRMPHIHIRNYSRLCAILGVVLFLCALYTSVTIDNKVHLSDLLALRPHAVLASRHSNGLIDNVTDDVWKRMQHKALTRQRYYNPSDPDMGYMEPVLWYTFNLMPEVTCPTAVQVGNASNKWVCNPQKLSTQRDCLVYSILSSNNDNVSIGDNIGSNGANNSDNANSNPIKHKASDESLSALLNGKCDIHTFGISRNSIGNNSPASNATYHGWSIDNTSNSTVDYQQSNLTTKSLNNTLYELSHQHRRIDILHVDCNNCEW
jgi:Methyltransferase domain